MKNSLEYNFRKAEHVEMINLMESIESVYRHDLWSTVRTFDTYEEISAETYVDYMKVCAKIEVLEQVGILLPTEEADLKAEANAIRLDILQEYEKIVNKED